MHKSLGALAVLVLLTGLPGGLVSRLMAREDRVLDSGWSFLSGEVAHGGERDVPLAGWQAVTLPHNWGWAEAHLGKPCYRGPGWYRYPLVLQPQAQRRYFLRFEAASTVADVYVNGKWLGQHRGGFGAFAYEITSQLAADGTNWLAVRVSNAPQPDLAPLSGDFNVYGGLYRPVHMIETGMENIAVTDHGSPGVAWLETQVTGTQAVVEVTAQISNGTDRNQDLTVTARLVDASGREAASQTQPLLVLPGYTEPAFARIVAPQPHLWQGRADPYLYTAILELRSHGLLVDEVRQSVGLRSYRVDPDHGFFLNGQPYPVYGVCRHQDRPEKGWAISDADMEEDVEILKELGATAVRCAHYQHSDYFYHLCDEAGILVWAEIPQVNLVHPTPEFEATSRGQLLDLIRQNLNHPSIFVWSLFNEIGGSRGNDPDRELQDLNNLAHGEDPTRPTIAAACVPNLLQMTKIPDLIGWNFYPGWYRGKGSLETFGAYLDGFRSSSRQGGYCVSEYGAGANIHQHEEQPAQPRPAGPWHPEEWQGTVHEADWAAIHSRPYIWGSFVWNIFDFCVASRHEGGQDALNDKGLVTYDRRTRKDAFYFYQANWSTAPVLHLTSKRFVERTQALTRVKIYSNARSVELLVNGVSLGSHPTDGECVFHWDQVRLAPGDNQIAARAVRDGHTLTDQCTWHYAAAP